jgi:hypothetical protein
VPGLGIAARGAFEGAYVIEPSGSWGSPEGERLCYRLFQAQLSSAMPIDVLKTDQFLSINSPRLSKDRQETRRKYLTVSKRLG